jgi:hypothetical protein
MRKRSDRKTEADVSSESSMGRSDGWTGGFRHRGVGLLTLVALMGGLGAIAPARAGPVDIAPWPLGEFVQLPGDPSCVPGFTCSSFAVTGCPDVSQDAEGVMAQVHPPGAPRGVAMFFSGARGTGWWGGGTGMAAQFMRRLRATHGFVVVQVKWVDSWLMASSGEDAGSAHLACRPATVVEWAYRNLFAPLGLSPGVGECGFCVTGNSGGATQSVYGLSQYGLDRVLDAVVPTSGPPHAALEKGCLPGFPGYEYDARGKKVIDHSHGFLESPGPCATEDPKWGPRWREESPETLGYDHSHPTTRVAFIIGGEDDSSAPVHAGDYQRALLANPTNEVTWTVVEGMGHSIQDSQEGLDELEAALVGP